MKNQDQYLQQLKAEIQLRLGYPIKKNADLLKLESIINTTLNVKKKISYSTLRRLFGFLPAGHPSNTTLDSLAQAIGNKSYSDFCLQQSTYPDNRLQEIINEVAFQNQLSSSQAAAILVFKHSPYYLNIFTQLIVRALHTQNTGLFASIFNRPELFPDIYRQQIHIADQIGQTLRKLPYLFIKQDLQPLLEQSELIQNYILYLFVDYTSFNGYYGKLIQSIDKNKIKNTDNQLFITLINNHIKFLKGLPLDQLLFHNIPKHPILLGRFHAQALLFPNAPIQINDIFKHLQESTSKQGYLFELLPVLLLTKDFNSLQKIEHKYYEQALTPNEFPFENKKIFTLIAFSATAIHFGQLQAARIMLDLIHTQQLYTSYRYYSELLACIPFYHYHQKTKQLTIAQKYQTQYKYLANKLGFTFFTEKFLTDFYK